MQEEQMRRQEEQFQRHEEQRMRNEQRIEEARRATAANQAELDRETQALSRCPRAHAHTEEQQSRARS